jgi:hypothetical protein
VIHPDSIRRHAEAFSATALTALLMVSAAGPAAGQAGTLIFSDGFESGNTLAWTASVGEPPLVPPEVLRFSDLDLRDPHLFAPVPVVGCFDFTDQDLPLGLGPSFNDQTETLITTDGDGDTLLDLSLLLQFRPLDPLGAGLRMDLASGLCTAPMAGTSCTLDPAAIPQTASYTGQAAGTCLAAVAGTTSGYTPAVGSTPAPCFVTLARPLTLTLNELPLPLRSFQLAGTFTGSPESVTNGLMRGFLRESDADSILLPAELPLVGGQPLSVLLPGGTGNCAPGDDRDTHEGVSGWWFYLSYPADPVGFTGS